MTGIAKVAAGALVKLADEREYVVRRFDTPTSVVLSDLESNEQRTVGLDQIRCRFPATRRQQTDLEALNEVRLSSAQARYAVIQPLLEAGRWTTQDVEAAAQAGGVDRSSVYRWLKQFGEGSMVSSLMRKERSDAGSAKLNPAVEGIIKQVITEYWLTPERRTPAAAYREVKRLCWNASPRLAPPSMSTFVTRLDQVDALRAAKKRQGEAAADKLQIIKGTMPFADRPYAVLQIDHTLVDIHLVDEVDRVCIGRPWLTVAIDVKSRMVAGYYVSFDPPGALGTGICLANAMLPKKAMLAQLGVDYDYPCMGKPHMVHLDNAKEFRGKTLERACQEYGINLMFRKIKKPRYGAHIERLMGTLMTEIQTLRGTSFSNTQERGDYDSQGRAVMTLKEFELWLANLILGAYHNRKHSSLGRPPLSEYTRGILGDGTSFGPGVIDVITDEERLRTDFLPLVEQTVQPYGIKIDHIHYRSDVLNRWVGARDPKNKRSARKFLCRRDPRDISSILFFDPDAQTYFRIPFRDRSRPAISLWELRAVRKHLDDQGKAEVDEGEIFKAFDEMRRIEQSSARQTSKVRRSLSSKQRKRRRDSPQPTAQQEPVDVPADDEVTAPADPPTPAGGVAPFDEIEWL
jgi:putative transposase